MLYNVFQTLRFEVINGHFITGNFLSVPQDLENTKLRETKAPGVGPVFLGLAALNYIKYPIRIINRRNRIGYRGISLTYGGPHMLHFRFSADLKTSHLNCNDGHHSCV